MTGEQWQAAWILCETAGDIDSGMREEYIRGATIDPDVQRQVLEILEELSLEPVYPAPPDPRRGDSIGRYILRDRIGQGGMGQVYSAHDTELHREVAIKFLPADLPLETAASHIIREGRSASSLNHPNIVTVHEIMQTEWGLAIVMELVEGRSLRATRRPGPLAKRETIQIGRQIASALSSAHAKGIVHRDIKPENVIVRLDGFVKVVDFGLAQNIRDGTAPGKLAHLPVGTVRYMSPEQKRGERVTGASDVYALGVVLEELGKWRHPLLTQMQSAAPERRPSAETVAATLERLDRSNYHPLIASGLLFVALIAGIVSIQYWRKTDEIHEPRFEQITKHSAGHDVTVAGLSPEGNRLAYSTVDGGLFLRNTLSSTVQELDAPAGLSVSQLFFLPNGALLAVGSNQGSYESWRIPLDGSAARRLRTNTHLVALSHDNRQIAWLSEDNDVWTGSLEGTDASPVYKRKPDERIAMILWSANDRRLWFHTLQHCRNVDMSKDAFVIQDFCENSDLTLYDPAKRALAVKVRNLRFTSGFITTTGEFLFLKQDIDRQSQALNLWSLSTDPETDAVRDTPRRLSHVAGVILSQLTGSRNGRTMAVIRTNSLMQTFVAKLQTVPEPALLNTRRLTLEQANSFPHAWTLDQQSLILESDRNGHLELFQQKLSHREPQLLATTSGDLYMPAITPDGNWLLAMFRPTPSPGRADDPSLHRLMRIPITGGAPVEVPIGGPLDEFRCSVPGHGTACILRTTEGDNQRFWNLDPIRGRGQEVGRANMSPGRALGSWGLSADGTHVIVPDRHRTGWFLDLRLDPTPAGRAQQMRHVEGLNIIDWIYPMRSGNGWLVSSGTADPYQVMEARSRTEGLYYVDTNLQPHALFKSYAGTSGILSPDEKQLAFDGAELTSNVWTFER